MTNKCLRPVVLRKDPQYFAAGPEAVLWTRQLDVGRRRKHQSSSADWTVCPQIGPADLGRFLEYKSGFHAGHWESQKSLVFGDILSGSTHRFKGCSAMQRDGDGQHHCTGRVGRYGVGGGDIIICNEGPGRHAAQL
jgi:hypothetical protein